MRTVYGHGINDVGRVKGCKIYPIWKQMIGRCYSKKVQDKNPSYSGCTVAEDWLLFSNFKGWYLNNFREGTQMDKDILSPKGESHYSPDTCIFISQALNIFLARGATGTSGLPRGVAYLKDKGKYQAKMRDSGRCRRSLGYYKTVSEAETAFNSARDARLRELISGEDLCIQGRLWEWFYGTMGRA